MELGGQHVAVAGHVPQRAAQNGLALAVGGGGVEQVDAEVQRPPHHPDGSGRRARRCSAPAGSDRRCPTRPPTPGGPSAQTADTACPAPPSRRLDSRLSSPSRVANNRSHAGAACRTLPTSTISSRLGRVLRLVIPPLAVYRSGSACFQAPSTWILAECSSTVRLHSQGFRCSLKRSAARSNVRRAARSARSHASIACTIQWN